MGKELFTTESGKTFRIESLAFANWLRGMGVKPGMDLGMYLRGDKSIPDAWVNQSSPVRGKSVTLKDLGATGRAIPRAPRTGPSKRGPDIPKLWEKLLQTIWKEVGKPDPAYAADLYVNMDVSGMYQDRADEDAFPGYLEGISADVGQNWEWSLPGKVQALWDRLSMALDSGTHKPMEYYERHQPYYTTRQARAALREIYASAWHDGMQKGWQQLKKNPAEMARLNKMRAEHSR